MLQDLLNLRARLLKELKSVPAFEKLQAIEEAIARFKAAGDNNAAEGARKPATRSVARERDDVRARRKAAADACAEFLMGASEDGKLKEVRTRVLNDHLVSRGLATAESDSVSSLYSVLARDPRFIHVSRGLWRLATPVERSVDERQGADTEGTEEPNG